MTETFSSKTEPSTFERKKFSGILACIKPSYEGDITVTLYVTRRNFHFLNI